MKKVYPHFRSSVGCLTFWALSPEFAIGLPLSRAALESTRGLKGSPPPPPCALAPQDTLSLCVRSENDITNEVMWEITNLFYLPQNVQLSK